MRSQVTVLSSLDGFLYSIYPFFIESRTKGHEVLPAARFLAS